MKLSYGQQASGAIISYEDDCIKKTSDTPPITHRLYAQKDYMRKLASLESKQCIIPKTQDHPNGYIMEKGEDIELWDISVPLLIRMMKMRLITHVWQHPPIIKTQEGWAENLGNYLKGVLNTHHIPDEDAKYLLFLVKAMEFEGGTECAIHGDCTVDNVLQPGKFIDKENVDGHVWISDPIPPDHRIPSHREVDLGKLLQSCIGWENMKYAGNPPIPIEMCIPEALALEDFRSKRLAWIWCAIHHVRILPYAVDPTRNAVIRSLTNVLNMIRNTYDQSGFKS